MFVIYVYGQLSAIKNLLLLLYNDIIIMLGHVNKHEVRSLFLYFPLKSRSIYFAK